MEKKSKLYISISGNIGSGKTLLTRLLSQELSWYAYYEKIIDNPYLELFYNDMKQWSFILQIHILAHKMKEQNEIKNRPDPCIQDRSIFEDAEVFTRTHHEEGYISDIDYNNYLTIFTTVKAQFKKPDLILYLKSPLKVLIKKILNRGRDFEQAIDPSYLEKLDQAYEKWISEKKLEGLKVLEIETDISIFEENKEELMNIIKYVKEVESQTCLNMD